MKNYSAENVRDLILHHLQADSMPAFKPTLDLSEPQKPIVFSH